MKLEIIAFGVHPDDVELGCGGTLIEESKTRKRVGIIDLTLGELGTRGTSSSRKREAAEASKIMGLSVRENLEMADGFFNNDQHNQLKVINILRKYRPEIIICNAPEDRHPDHGRAAKLVGESAFLSGLIKIATESEGISQKPWRPKYVLNYIQDKYITPNFVIDISSSFDQKIEAVKAYKTQFFDPISKEPETYISSPEFLDSVVYRAKMFGKMIGVKYAEGFISEKMIGLRSFDALIKENT